MMKNKGIGPQCVNRISNLTLIGVEVDPPSSHNLALAGAK
jgi:hypothetical protein